MSGEGDAVVLFADDFSTLPVGVIAGDYSPAGEYHVVPALADSGRWRETVLHHSYARISHGNWQVIEELDGARALEQTIAPEQWQPMLAAGDPFWREVTVEAKLRPLTEQGWRAILFRYRHGRRFYGCAFSEHKVCIIRRDNDDDSILGEAPWRLDPERYTPVRIACCGRQVALWIDGKKVLECADASAEFFEQGGVGFGASDVTRFRELRVTAPPAAAAAAAREAEAARIRETQARARHPRAVLWKKIATPRWGTDRNLRVGDLNGDGRAEFVLARRTERLGGDDHASIASLAAYSLDGEQLWTLGNPGSNERHTTADLCFQVHDIDGDGKAEVLFCKDFEFCIADGATGKIRRRMPLPQPVLKTGWPRSLYRILGDAIFFCDLAGSGRDDSIILKDRYKNAWAYDRELKPLWQFSGNLGHFPFARDIDGDGRDEVAFGYHLLDHDGTPRWSVKYKEHADNIAFVDLHDGGGRRPAQTRVVIAGSDAGFIILDLEGRERVHYPIGHAQGFCAANLLPERDGLEIMCNTFWGPVGITGVFDEAGKLLHEFEPMPYACLLQPVNWVPLDAGPRPADLVLLSAHTRQGGLIDGRGDRLVMFPDDGHPVLCSDARDLDGDGLDEVLTWDSDAIWIYKADRVPGREPRNYPKRNPWYNDSNYRAQISLPKERTKGSTKVEVRRTK